MLLSNSISLNGLTGGDGDCFGIGVLATTLGFVFDNPKVKLGGISWATVESYWVNNHLQRELGKTFANWGIPTADCIQDIHHQFPQIPLIASGGIRNGLDVTKLLAMGADIVGLAYPFLKTATESVEAINNLVELTNGEIKTTLFCTGNQNITDLQLSQCVNDSTVT